MGPAPPTINYRGQYPQKKGLPKPFVQLWAQHGVKGEGSEAVKASMLAFYNLFRNDVEARIKAQDFNQPIYDSVQFLDLMRVLQNAAERYIEIGSAERKENASELVKTLKETLLKDVSAALDRLLGDTSSQVKDEFCGHLKSEFENIVSKSRAEAEKSDGGEADRLRDEVQRGLSAKIADFLDWADRLGRGAQPASRPAARPTPEPARPNVAIGPFKASNRSVTAFKIERQAVQSANATVAGTKSNTNAADPLKRLASNAIGPFTSAGDRKSAERKERLLLRKRQREILDGMSSLCTAACDTVSRSVKGLKSTFVAAKGLIGWKGRILGSIAGFAFSPFKGIATAIWNTVRHPIRTLVKSLQGDGWLTKCMLFTFTNPANAYAVGYIMGTVMKYFDILVVKPIQKNVLNPTLGFLVDMKEGMAETNESIQRADRGVGYHFGAFLRGAFDFMSAAMGFLGRLLKPSPFSNSILDTIIYNAFGAAHGGDVAVRLFGGTKRFIKGVIKAIASTMGNSFANGMLSGLGLPMRIAWLVTAGASESFFSNFSLEGNDEKGYSLRPLTYDERKDIPSDDREKMMDALVSAHVKSSRNIGMMPSRTEADRAEAERLQALADRTVNGLSKEVNSTFDFTDRLQKMQERGDEPTASDVKDFLESDVFSERVLREKLDEIAGKMGTDFNSATPTVKLMALSELMALRRKAALRTLNGLREADDASVTEAILQEAKANMGFREAPIRTLPITITRAVYNPNKDGERAKPLYGGTEIPGWSGSVGPTADISTETTTQGGLIKSLTNRNGGVSADHPSVKFLESQGVKFEPLKDNRNFVHTQDTPQLRRAVANFATHQKQEMFDRSVAQLFPPQPYDPSKPLDIGTDGTDYVKELYRQRQATSDEERHAAVLAALETVYAERKDELERMKSRLAEIMDTFNSTVIVGDTAVGPFDTSAKGGSE